MFGDADRVVHDPLLERLRIATAGAYEVVAELGRGGMAVVYGGVDRKLERRVAIKVMDPRLSMTQGMSARFLQEARIAARLQHPNIIVVHDVRQSDEIIFFVMSLIDGVGVDELCRQPQQVPIDQVRWILLQATRALAYAHSEGIVHRDIKPANILLNVNGDVILTDFGIAKALGDTGLTQSGTQIGTPMYMSPEQFSGVPVGPASDQYALGVTAYQMIAGTPPFSGDLYQLIAAHGSKAPVPLQDIRPDCPPFLANAVMRMLEKQPEQRWPSLDDLQDVFGANMAMDGGVARRQLAAAVRTLRPGAMASGAVSDPGRAVTPIRGQQRAESLVVTISPPGATVFVSGTLELRASVALETGQSMPGTGVQWSSSNDAVLSVTQNGIVTGIAPGSAVVRAVVQGGSSSSSIRVEAAPIARLSMSGPSLAMRVGDVLRPDVVAMDVNGVARSDEMLTWISRSPAIADLDGPGVVRALAPGMAILDVSAGNVRRSIEVIVSRRPIAQLRIAATARALSLGDAVPLTVHAFDDLGAPVDATPARWTSNAPSVVHVDSSGCVLAIGPGVARITVAVDEATDSIEMQSLEPAIGSMQLALSDPDLEVGDETTYTLRVKDERGASRSTAGVRVVSADPRIVRVDDATQCAVGVSVGETILRAAADGTDATAETPVRVRDVMVASLDVFPEALDIEVGAVAALNVRGVDRRGRQVLTTSPRWESDGTDCAVVEGQGIVRGLAPGSCRIRASVANLDGTTAEMIVAVRVRRSSIARLAISAERSMLEVGEAMTLRATTFDAMDAEVSDATPLWRSMQPDVVRVDGQGQVVALAPGRATVLVELDGKSGQFALLVAPSSIVSLAVAPVSTDVLVGVATGLSITAQDRNGHAVEPPVRWSVDPADAGTVTATGVVTPAREGTLRVRASLIVPTDATGILSARSALDAIIELQARAPKSASIAFANAKEDVSSTMTVRVVAARAASSPSRWLAMAAGAVAVVSVAWVMWPKGTSAPRRDTSVAERPAAAAEAPAAVAATEPAAVDTSPVSTSSSSRTASTAAREAAVVPPTANVKPSAVRPGVRPAPVPSKGTASASVSAAAPPTLAPVPQMGYTTAQAPPVPVPTPTPVVEAPVPKAAEPTVAPAITYEVPSLGEVRAIAERIVRQVRTGTRRPTSDLLLFFTEGSGHSVEIRTAPVVTAPEQGLMRTQFEVALTRFGSSGMKENRFLVVRMDVAKRNGNAELVDERFGPLTRFSGGR